MPPTLRFVKSGTMRFLIKSLPCLLLSVCIQRNIETITVKGSDTEVNLVLQMAEAYMDTDQEVSVSRGGRGVGLAGLLKGE